MVCGLVPLLPYLFGLENAFLFATVLTGVVFFVIGSVRSLWSTIGWFRSGSETFIIGSAAAALAYIAGVLLQGLA
jgi:VIT1/CCC1 family predicted Fe2+/Mn2+ transporter